MLKTTVVVIGGGSTGVGILRDLSMRGVDTILVEQQDLSYGASSHYHGLLHSGGRYAVKDFEAARECIDENRILRKIGKSCVEDTEGFFIRSDIDDESFEEKWIKACVKADIPAVPISVKDARKLEPNLSSKIKSVYKVPDAAIDGFRLVWQNVASAKLYGGKILNYTTVVGIDQENGKVVGLTVKNTLTGEQGKIVCDIVINAAGSWAGKIAMLSDIKLNIQPDKGTLVAFNHRITSRIINRLRPASDGDIFVPHGSITILGTTSKAVDNPDDTIPSTKEVLDLLDIGEVLFEDIRNYRILRTFAGTRPLYVANPNDKGRGLSRGFVTLDHSIDGLDGFYSVVGGKLTTYRLMAEKMTDIVCKKLNIKKECRTATEELIEGASPDLLEKAHDLFPAYGANLAATRLGYKGLKNVLKRIEANPAKKQCICECENVTIAEVEEAANEPTTHSLSDIRRKTRMGMGTCQGAFCTFRTVGVISCNNLAWGKPTSVLFKDFLQSRWKGIRPILWGNVMREMELTRGIYECTLNINGAYKNYAK